MLAGANESWAIPKLILVKKLCNAILKMTLTAIGTNAVAIDRTERSGVNAVSYSPLLVSLQREQALRLDTNFLLYIILGYLSNNILTMRLDIPQGDLRGTADHREMVRRSLRARIATFKRPSTGLTRIRGKQEKRRLLPDDLQEERIPFLTANRLVWDLKSLQKRS
jgi:hypothetical protein